MARARLLGLVLMVALAASGCAFLTRSSVGSPPARTQADAASSSPAVSAHGRFTAFASTATDLVPDDTNGVSDVFVHDNVDGTTTRVSVTGSGTQLTSASSHPSISDDGRYVAFETASGAPDPTDTNGVSDVYVTDRRTGAVTRASNLGAGSSTPGCHHPVLSGDGSTVAYQYDVAYYAPRNPPFVGFDGPVVHHLDTGTTVAFSQTTSSSFTFVGDYDLSFGGGTVVATRSALAYSTFVFTGDTRTGTKIQEISVDSSKAHEVAISADGSRVAYTDTDLAGGDIRVAGASSLDQPDATMTTGRVASLSISSDGSWLGAQVHVGDTDVAARRTADGRGDWETVSRTADDSRVIATSDAVMSRDGQWSAFVTPDPNVVGGDTNGVADVFTRSGARGAPPTPT